MENNLYIAFLVFPFAILAIMWVFLIFMNRVTTGEVKYIMPPDVLLKTFALFILVAAIFIMGMEKIIAESTVSALLGAIATGVLGISLKKTE
ncbi:hypothetical protein [Pseudomonas syringae]|uniref:hypothetical protein n=1 Tax=Pseudomonas syringae TaxID=317 RepID=UPI000464B3A6|nr:hypothetical protein [Pseudomonas syringae]KWS18423.1 hypothetical protein AL062_25540 [Pseudomonas syringae pv. syringae]MCH5515536.1 hypothetical protein [Pseudomonas syringae pv. syringae]MCH5626990.1 hypothetical protein [Pseudomonas syringae pv. syringae]MDY2563718.1 hypothetical protein [Pseudomonas syringae]RXT67898.1 hypothetical protein B1F74_02660 [Pseudomonas syringae]